jgi:hypothetical protein
MADERHGGSAPDAPRVRSSRVRHVGPRAARARTSPFVDAPLLSNRRPRSAVRRAQRTHCSTTHSVRVPARTPRAAGTGWAAWGTQQLRDDFAVAPPPLQPNPAQAQRHKAAPTPPPRLPARRHEARAPRRAGRIGRLGCCGGGAEQARTPCRVQGARAQRPAGQPPCCMYAGGASGRAKPRGPLGRQPSLLGAPRSPRTRFCIHCGEGRWAAARWRTQQVLRCIRARRGVVAAPTA